MVPVTIFLTEEEHNRLLACIAKLNILAISPATHVTPQSLVAVLAMTKLKDLECRLQRMSQPGGARTK